MAREYARIRISIADDEDFERLSVGAQWLYMRVLIPDPTLNQCGVADWRPNRLLGKASGVSLDYMMAAAAELEQGRYALFDTDTEEVLVRTYIRNDELLRNPKMAVSVVKAYRSVASKPLRAGIVSELKKAKAENPQYACWTSPMTKDDLSQLVMRPDLEEVGYTNQFGNHIGNTVTNHIGNDNAAGYQSDLHHIPCSLQPAPTPINLQPEGGYVSRELTSAHETPEPPPRCPRHLNNPTNDPCIPCRGARIEHERWERDEKRRQAEAKSAALRQAAEDRARAVANCTMCDDDGQLGRTNCSHDPDEIERNKRGSAAVRAALVAKSNA